VSAHTVKDARDKRARRVRRRIRHDGPGKLRLSVFRSSKNISAQIIDDVKGETLVAASSLEADAKKGLKTGANTDAATAVGKLIAARARDKGVQEVVFDRGGYLYHGRVKALAEAAREGGLKF
jgi:large subunit ribosomal protein L18